MERTFILIKPGVLQRRLVGEVVSRFERKGLKIVALKMVRMDEDLAERHYAEHVGKPYYAPLVSYMCSGPSIAAVLEGEGAIALVRKLLGPTSVEDAPAGTIRGDFAAHTRKNIVHASDSPASAAREIALYFDEREFFEWEDGNDEWY